MLLISAAAAAFSAPIMAPRAGAQTPTEYGVKWAQSYNQQAAKKGWPDRFTAIACRNHDGLLVCGADTRNVRTGKVTCVDLLIGTEGQILGGQKVKCDVPAGLQA